MKIPWVHVASLLKTYLKVHICISHLPIFKMVRTLSVPAGELEFALCDLTYCHQLYIFYSALKNNKVLNCHIIDRYYNVCELNEDVFQRMGAELNLHAPPGGLQLYVTKKTSGIKQKAGKNPWIYSGCIWNQQNLHCRETTQSCYPSRDLCTFLR